MRCDVSISGEERDKRARFQVLDLRPDGIYRFYNEASKRFLCKSVDDQHLLVARGSFEPDYCWFEINQMNGVSGDPIVIPLRN